jgi:chromosome segregation ATPase
MEELLKSFMSQINQQCALLSKEIGELKESLEGRMDRLEGRMEKLEKNQENLALTVKQNATEFRSHYVKIETELEQQRDAYKIYATDLNKVITDIEYLSGKTGIHDTKINNIEKRLEV